MWAIKKFTGYMNRAIIQEARVVTDNLSVLPDIQELFQAHHFQWMSRKLGHYGILITTEFYSVYVASLLNLIEDETSRKRKNSMPVKPHHWILSC